MAFVRFHNFHARERDASDKVENGAHLHAAHLAVNLHGPSVVVVEEDEEEEVDSVERTNEQATHVFSIDSSAADYSSVTVIAAMDKVRISSESLEIPKRTRKQYVFQTPPVDEIYQFVTPTDNRIRYVLLILEMCSEKYRVMVLWNYTSTCKLQSIRCRKPNVCQKSQINQLAKQRQD